MSILDADKINIVIAWQISCSLFQQVWSMPLNMKLPQLINTRVVIERLKSSQYRP